jgi:folate-binding Fe-S cluster repair protein YgfZ
MSSSWLEFLGTCGARTARGVVTDFGDAAAELAAARTATIVSPLRHLGVLEVSGADAMSFLHQQLTSDVKHLAEDAAQHSAWCSAKGRMLASFLVFRKGPAYHLQLSADLLPLVRKRLQMFVLRSKVHIADQSGAQELLGVSGPQAETSCAWPACRSLHQPWARPHSLRESSSASTPTASRLWSSAPPSATSGKPCSRTPAR